MSSMLDSIKKIVYTTAHEATEKKLSKNTADVVKALVGSVADAVDNALVKVQELTKPEETTPEGEGES